MKIELGMMPVPLHITVVIHVMQCIAYKVCHLCNARKIYARKVTRIKTGAQGHVHLIKGDQGGREQTVLGLLNLEMCLMLRGRAQRYIFSNLLGLHLSTCFCVSLFQLWLLLISCFILLVIC